MKAFPILFALLLSSCATAGQTLPGEFETADWRDVILRAVQIEGGTRYVLIEGDRKKSLYFKAGIAGIGGEADFTLAGIRLVDDEPLPPLPDVQPIK